MNRRTPLAAAACVLAALALSPAQAAFPGENGRIAFERGFNVWTMNPDGTDATQVTTSGATFDPAYGPDGRRIAFARQADIWVMNADGSDQQNLTGPAGLNEGHPAWSPDGTRIAFWRRTPEAGTQIWIMNADGTSPYRLTDGPELNTEPAWSPDGQQIAYNSARRIYTIDAPPAGVVPAPRSGTPYFVPGEDQGTADNPTWAPDGSAIAFQWDQPNATSMDIYKQVGAGNTPTLIATGQGTDEIEPSWSPDGTRIAFESNRSGRPQIWTVGSGGPEEAPVRLSPGTTIEGQPDWGVRPAAPPGPPPPEIGETVNAEIVKGRVLVKLPPASGSGRAGAAQSDFIPLSEATQLPIGTTFNTKRGTVRLTTAASATTDAVQKGNFRGGVFKTRQSRSNPLTELRLRGAGLNRCSKLPKGGAATARRRARKLFGRTRRGRFRTRGRNSTATVRGTKWLTKDTCRGTLTVVRSGSVTVRDLVKRKNITLKRGKRTRYLARAPKRR